MDESFNIERYKADQARARALGFDYARLREIILLAGSDCEEGISVGRAVELIREIGLRAVDAAVAEDRAAVVAWLRTRERQIENWPPGGMNEVSLTYSIIADEIERGEHRREEEL
jgi:hypothetical protein